MEFLFLDSLEGVAEVMKEQLERAQKKGCDLKVARPPCSRGQAHLIVESYTHGRLRTIRILVRSLEEIIGNRMWPRGTNDCVRDVKVTVSKFIYQFQYPSLADEQVDRCGTWCRSSRPQEGRWTCPSPAGQLRIHTN